MLIDSNIKRIAAEVAKVCKADMDTATIKRIKVAIQETNVAVENLWQALEYGQSVDNRAYQQASAEKVVSGGIARLRDKQTVYP